MVLPPTPYKYIKFIVKDLGIISCDPETFSLLKRDILSSEFFLDTESFYINKINLTNRNLVTIDDTLLNIRIFYAYNVGRSYSYNLKNLLIILVYQCSGSV